MPTEAAFSPLHPSLLSVPRGRLRELLVFRGRGWDLPPGRERRLRNVDLIEHRAGQAGLSLRAAAAMVANAWAESRLNDQAVNETPKESAYGLFQLSSKNFTPATRDQMRKGTRAQRLDPAFNVDYMLWEVRGVPGYWFRRRDKEGAAADELSMIFARDLERCGACGDAHRGVTNAGKPRIVTNPYRPSSGDPEAALKIRTRTAQWMFPTLSGATPQTPTAPPPPQRPWYQGPWTGLLVIGGIALSVWGLGGRST